MTLKSIYHDLRNQSQKIIIGPVSTLLVMFLCSSLGCLSETNFALIKTDWATRPSTFRTNTSVKTQADDLPETTWKLSGAPGETLGKSFLIRVYTPTTPFVSFNISSLLGPNVEIDSSNIKIFSVESVRIKNWPGWHIRSIPPSQRQPVVPDVLVPVDAPGSNLADGLEAGVDHYFWVDIALPRDIAPGDYFGELHLKDGNTVLSTIAIDLSVCPFLLPKPSPITFVVDVDHRSLVSHHLRRQGRPLELHVDDWSGAANSSSIDHLIQQTMATLRDHGLNPVLPELSPPLKITSSNEVSPDWDHYRSLVTPALSGTIFGDQGGLTRWPIPIKPLASLRARSGNTTTNPLHETLALHYLQQCANEFDRLGVLSRSYLLADQHVVTNSPKVLALKYANWSLATKPGLQIIRWGVPQDLRPYGWIDYTTPTSLGEAVGWLIPGQFFDPATSTNLQNKGKRTWLQLDRPPYTGSLAVAAPASYARVIAWQALLLNADTVFLGQACHWPAADMDDKPQACIDFDSNTLLYPGRPFGVDHPLVSLRLKYLRQGIQDIAYDALLRQHNLGHIARTVSQAIVARVGTQAYRTHFADGRTVGWPTDWRHFDIARDIYIEELSRSTAAPHIKNQSSELTRSVRWRKLMKDMRHLEIQCDGTRIRLMGDNLSPELEIQSSVSISNLSRASIQGSLQYEALPKSWTPEQASFPLQNIRPTHSGRVQVSSTCPLSNQSFSGDQRFSITLTTDDGQSMTTHAHTRLIAASRGSLPIVIDGELTDWKDATTNVLRDFELISPTETEYSHSERPTSGTLAFVKRDDEFLYIAVQSNLIGKQHDPKSRRNRIEYDDMIPTGSELIEILLDPLNAGTRSPSDLYHIVVMNHGGDYAEKGVRFDPPCGRSTPWAVNIQTATTSSENRWTAEIAIPFSAFGPVASNHTIWGFNITRFDLSNQEFSTWSGARLNAYDPISLGNLLLP